MSPDAVPAVEARGLVKLYDETPALTGVDLTVAAGRVHGLVGPNGAGKSTLLSVLLGLLRPEAGRLRLLGRDHPGTGTPPGVAGFVETPRCYPYLSARRNLALLAGLDGAGAGADRIASLLETVGLGGREDERVRGYSVGMRQRLGVAAALLRSPRLLVLDEPATGLDPVGTRDLHALVRRLAADGTAVLLSSHDMDEVEDLCEDVTVLAAGTVVFDGSMERLRTEAPSPSYALTTADDAAALRVAGDVTGVRVDADKGMLTVHAEQADLDAYVVALGRAGVAVRGLALTTSPLAAMFFRLTESGGSEPSPATDPAPEVVV